MNRRCFCFVFQAEDVFSSLAIPLMKLVGLKIEEMAEEGRFTAIIVDADFSPVLNLNFGFMAGPGIPYRNGLSLTPESPTAVGGEWNDQIYRKEENCAAKAIIAGKEFYEKQETQLLQLVHLLRQVENRFIISAFHSQNHGIFLITQKLLQLIFYKTDAVLSSVEDNVQGLMEDLAERMCNLMVEYAKGLRADLKIGTCARLLDTVDEMEICMRNGRIELEEARKKVRVAEERRIKALCKLKETEEKVRKMKQYHEFIAAIQNQHIEQLASSKV
ncbi:hypothetical protein Gotur_031617 [Gossypium turneri]